MARYNLDVRITVKDQEVLEKLERYIQQEYGRHRYGIKSLIVKQALEAFLDERLDRQAVHAGVHAGVDGAPRDA